MWFSNDDRGVQILVRGKFVAPRQWLIHATVAGGSGIDPAIRTAARRRTLGELWQGILFERRVGRHLGAVAVRVVVDGDRDIASVFGATGNAEGSPAPVPWRGSSVPRRAGTRAPSGVSTAQPGPAMNMRSG